jgi:hypothetical protein
MMEDPVLRETSTQHSNQRNIAVPVGVAQLNESELSGRVDDKVFRHLGHVDHHQTRPLQEFDNEISVGYDMHRVLAERVESELLLEELSVDGVGVAC